MYSQNTCHSICLSLLLALLSVPGMAQQGQVRDHLTEKEDELLREFQVIDKRIDIFIKAADRRLMVLADPNAKQKKSDEQTWGPLPTGSKLELLQDYKRILLEAEEKMDDGLYRGRSAALEKALGKFKESALRQIPLLRALAPQLADKREQKALEEAIAEAETVSQASFDK
ncbi:MAG: hypothetical protein J2P41_13750 [Blastocatellia bacterium]|nr:hypothetical protein [Blastocatellia bacterium]